MDARALDMLHDAGDQDVLPVADGVHLQLHTHEIFVDKDGILNILGQNDRHVFPDILVAEGDDHILPAQHIGGSHQTG